MIVIILTIKFALNINKPISFQIFISNSAQKYIFCTQIIKVVKNK